MVINKNYIYNYNFIFHYLKKIFFNSLDFKIIKFKIIII